MGFVLEQTPPMGEYSGEVRRESFYLHGADLHQHAYEGEELPRHAIIVYPISGPACTHKGPTCYAGTAELLIEDIPKIRAVLDAVEACAQGECR